MAQTTYQVAELIVSSDVDTAARACWEFTSAIQNAVAYGLVLERVLLDGSGRLRFSLNNPLPPEELASFAGRIIQV